jgi:hypothetical protein
MHSNNRETVPQTPAAEDSHLVAYNGTFWDLGFKWQWDAETYASLCGLSGEKERIRSYVERHQPHLAKAYDLEFLIDLIHTRKTLRHAAMTAAHESGRPQHLSCNGVRGN